MRSRAHLRLGGALGLCLHLAGAQYNTLNPLPPASHLLVTVTTGSAVSLYDYTATGSLTQSVAVPGCVLGTGANQGYGSMSADYGWAIFSCGTANSYMDDRLIVRVGADGIIDTGTMIQSYRNAYVPRGLASGGVDASGNFAFYAADGECLHERRLLEWPMFMHKFISDWMFGRRLCPLCICMSCVLLADATMTSSCT